MATNAEICKGRYQWLKEHHICVRCGKEDAAYGFVCCPACLEKMATRKRDRAKENELRKLRDEKRKALGICRKCDRPVCANSKIWCAYHNQVNNSRRLRKYHETKTLLSPEERIAIWTENVKKATLATKNSEKAKEQRKKIRKTFALFYVR